MRTHIPMHSVSTSLHAGASATGWASDGHVPLWYHSTKIKLSSACRRNQESQLGRPTSGEGSSSNAAPGQVAGLEGLQVISCTQGRLT